MKEEHQGIRAAIDLYHQIQKEASETSCCHESGAAIKQLLSYYWKSVHSGFCAVCLENHKPKQKNTRCLLHLLTRNMQGTLKPDLNIKVIFWITNWVIVSIRGFIILQPKTVVADRGTDMCDPKRFWRVLKSDFNIMLRCEKHNKGVKNANTQFQQAANKYKKQRYTLDTTELFICASGFSKPLCKGPSNTWNYSHKHDIVFFGASLSKVEREVMIRVWG